MDGYVLMILFQTKVCTTMSAFQRYAAIKTDGSNKLSQDETINKDTSSAKDSIKSPSSGRKKVHKSYLSRLGRGTHFNDPEAIVKTPSHDAIVKSPSPEKRKVGKGRGRGLLSLQKTSVTPQNDKVVSCASSVSSGFVEDTVDEGQYSLDQDIIDTDITKLELESLKKKSPRTTRSKLQSFVDSESPRKKSPRSSKSVSQSLVEKESKSKKSPRNSRSTSQVSLESESPSQLKRKRKEQGIESVVSNSDATKLKGKKRKVGEDNVMESIQGEQCSGENSPANVDKEQRKDLNVDIEKGLDRLKSLEIGDTQVTEIPKYLSSHRRTSTDSPKTRTTTAPPRGRSSTDSPQNQTTFQNVPSQWYEF